MTLRAVLFATSVFVLISISSGLTAAEWYVDAWVAGSGNGQTWGTAFKTIREGISGASDGDTVIVAQGEYVENIYLDGKNIILRSTDPLDPDVVEGTIIDGNEFIPVVSFSGTEDETCVVSGLTIRNGSGAGAGICGGERLGEHTHATIQNNVISGNSAHGEFGRGGGMAFCDGTIQNNTITGNSAWWGGGLADCNGTIRKNVISDNFGERDGGGLYDCDGMIEDNTISGNSANYGGGGLYGCDGIIQNNTISGNSAHGEFGSGAGVAFCDGTIQNNVISGNSAQRSGGGLLRCNGTVQNNTISRNTTNEYGGGLFGCDGIIQNNAISGNSGFWGGGLAYCNATIESNIITANEAGEDGGGLSRCDGTIQNNVISGNTAQRSGGGLVSCNGTIQNNVVSENSAELYGGGLAYCNGTIQNNLIAGNLSEQYGGGLAYCSDGTIQSSLISGNSAGLHAGGLYYCRSTIENNTICSNSAGGFGGGLSECEGPIVNCIIWANSAIGHAQLYECALPTYSCIEGWTRGGEGNISSDPQFVDLDGPDEDPATFDDNDCRLLVDSPCIDAGNNENWMRDAVDLDGNPRIVDGHNDGLVVVDMGAYEYRPFRIVEVTRTDGGEIGLTWNSRPAETYTIWSCSDLSGQNPWSEEETILSQGRSTTWADPDTTSIHKFYRIELK